MAQPNLEGLSIHEEEEGNFCFDFEEEDEVEVDLRWCLIGRFLCDKTIHFNSMKVRMAEVWKPVKGVTIKEATTGKFLFHFAHPLDMEAVLNGGPWTFDHNMLVLERVQLGMQMEHISLNFVNMWVQVHDLPMGLMKEKVGTQLANYIGTFVEYDNNNNSSFWRQYMRIRVKIDVRLPLKKVARVKNKDGNWCTVKFKYEKLGIFCFVCGVMGHGENKCEVRFSMEHDDGTREWSTKIRADSRRQGGRITSRWLKEEGGGGVEQGGGAMAGQAQAHGRNPYGGAVHADVAAESFNNNHNSPESNQVALVTRQAQSLATNVNQTPPAAHITHNINTISQSQIGNASPNQLSVFPAFISPHSNSLNGPIPSMIDTPTQMPNPFPNINSPIISPIILSQQKTDCIKNQSLSHQLLTFTSPPQQRDPQPSHQKFPQL
jgi:14-3-3 protein epsilon